MADNGWQYPVATYACKIRGFGILWERLITRTVFLRLRHPSPCGLRVAGHPETEGRRVSPEAPQERRETVATCGTSISSNSAMATSTSAQPMIFAAALRLTC